MPITRCDFDKLEKITRRFRREVWTSVPFDAVVESGVDVRDFGPIQATVFEDLPATRRLNTIEGVAEPGAVGEGHLGEAIEWMRSREVEYRVVVSSARPEARLASEWLAERGFEEGHVRTKYVREATPPHLPVLPGVEVLELSNPEQGEGMSIVAQEGLDLPGISSTLFFSLHSREDWHCYVALLDEELAACAAMLIDDGVAALGIDVTSDWARRQGCHQALLTRRMLDALVADCHTIFTEVPQSDTAKPAHRNLLCAGFEHAYTCQDWERPNAG